jgi:hypothetical protein
MFVSVEVITMIASAVSVIVAFASACGWVIRRMDARFERVDARFDRLEDRLSGVEHELTEVKISIARLEGPQPRLVTSR